MWSHSPGHAGQIAERILIVDDFAPARVAIRRILQRGGWEVHAEACDGAGALATLNAEPAIDLVLLDVDLPDMSGVEVATSIAGREDVTVVLVSARDPGEVGELARACGALGGLCKSDFSVGALGAILDGSTASR